MRYKNKKQSKLKEDTLELIKQKSVLEGTENKEQTTREPRLKLKNLLIHILEVICNYRHLNRDNNKFQIFTNKLKNDLSTRNQWIPKLEIR